MNTQLNYHHLRYFLAVATNGGITAASEAIHVSAPTLSAQLKELEAFFGKPLFRREGRQMRLTEDGRHLLRYAERIFATGDEMVEVLQRGKSAGPGTVFLGVSDGVPKLLVARLLDRAFHVAPSLQCVVREGQPQELWGALGLHQVDLVIANEAPPPNLANLPTGLQPQTPPHPWSHPETGVNEGKNRPHHLQTQSSSDAKQEKETRGVMRTHFKKNRNPRFRIDCFLKATGC